MLLTNTISAETAIDSIAAGNVFELCACSARSVHYADVQPQRATTKRTVVRSMRGSGICGSRRKESGNQLWSPGLMSRTGNPRNPVGCGSVS